MATYALSNKGATPKYQNSFLNSLQPPSPSNPQPTSGASQNMQLGNTTGMLNQSKPMADVSTPPVINVGGKSQVMKGSPSVIKQQQELNKLGAGLVVDGIAGEKTKAAIAKYGSAAASTPTTTKTPAKTSSSSEGYSTIPGPYDAKTGKLKETPPAPPAELTVKGQVPGLLQSGQQTENEKQMQTGLVGAGQVTDWEKQARNTPEVQKAVQALADFDQAVAKEYADLENSSIPLEFQQGRGQVLARQYASQRAALASAVTNALTSQGQQLNAAGTQASRGATTAGQAYTGSQTQAGRATNVAGTALGAVAPQFPSYGSQIIQPGMLGQTGSGDSSLQSAVSNVVQKLTSGTMTYNDALNALSGYGQGGLNALQQALPPNFNIAQSNTLAGQQGSIGVNYQLAETALNNVESLMNELNASQRTNIPGVNALTQRFSTLTGLGSEQTRAVTGAVQSLRNAYASLLASTKGGTPTDYSGQALAEIPDQPTPNDLKAIRHNFEVLGKARADILGNPGQASGTSSSGTGGLYDW